MYLQFPLEYLRGDREKNQEYGISLDCTTSIPSGSLVNAFELTKKSEKYVKYFVPFFLVGAVQLW